VERGELSVGDKVMVYVVAPENRSGNPVLSVDRARAKSGWLTMQKHLDAGETLNVRVVDVNRGGLMVDAEGLRGFVPLSQTVGLRSGSNEEETLENLRTAVGREIEVKILELDHRRNRLILSERLATLERRGRRREELLNELRVGDIKEGRVASISDFGAFVDIGGADGLVHLSELTWGQVNHPSDVVKVGDELEVMVINVDQERKRIGLSLRRAQSEPWDTVVERYTVGDVVPGVITKLTKFGAFARLEEGVEGLIHISEMGTAHIEHPRSVVHEGQNVMIRILRIDTERRRIGLSLNQEDEELMVSGLPLSYGPPPRVDTPEESSSSDEEHNVQGAVPDEGAPIQANESVGSSEQTEDD
jgi:small subunit ribosomal protein S1